MAVRELKEHGLKSNLSKSIGNATTIHLYTQYVQVFGQRVRSDERRCKQFAERRREVLGGNDESYHGNLHERPTKNSPLQYARETYI